MNRKTILDTVIGLALLNRRSVASAAALWVRRFLVAAVVVAAGSLTFTAASASAAFSHVFTTTFGAAASAPENPYPLSNPTDVAVDNSSGTSAGDVYVTDPANHRVEKFSPSGEFLLMFGKEVNKTKVETPLSTEAEQNVCEEGTGDVCQAGVSTQEPGGFTTPSFVAVDSAPGPSAGDVYVADTAEPNPKRISKLTSSGDLIASYQTKGQLQVSFHIDGITVDHSGNLFVLHNGSVREYEEVGNEIAEIEDPRGTQERGLALDSEDNLYAINGDLAINKFSPSGAVLSESITGEEGGYVPAWGLEIDPVTNNLYEDYEGEDFEILEYELKCGENCSPIERFGGGYLHQSRGLGVSNASTVYVANEEAPGDVAEFATKLIPDAVTGEASNLGSTSATLNGHADPLGLGEITECYFEYGTTEKYGSTQPCSQPTPYVSATDVSASVEGLERFSLYHYRLVVKNAEGVYTGPDRSFRTPGVPINSFTETPSTTQAGEHPNIAVRYGWSNSYLLEFPTECFCQDAENIKAGLPAGVIGDPHATLYCSRIDFVTRSCSPSTQVGVVSVEFFGFYEETVPLYNLEPSPDQAGFFGFFAPLAETPIFTVVSARTGSDYGLNLTTAGIEHIIAPSEIGFKLWGVPAESSHNPERYGGNDDDETGFPSEGEPIPFLDDPTTCGANLTGELEIQAYDGGVTTATTEYGKIEGCDDLTFNPSLYAQPTTTDTDSASGLEVDLSVPQRVVARPRRRRRRSRPSR